MSILVLGVGNILLSDEGVGVRVIESFRDRWQVPDTVEVVDGGTCGLDLLDVIAERDHVIVVDAIRLDEAPGTMAKYVGEQVPALFQTRISPHQLGLTDVLGVLKLLEREPKALTLLGVVPEDLQPSLDLSPLLAERRDELVELLVEELRVLGVAVTSRQVDAPPSTNASGRGA